jgi:pimeloyl-ACP methyl ester carboxylesterase
MPKRLQPIPYQCQLASDFQLAGWRLGATSNEPPVLALHGWLDNANSFLPLARALPALNWLSLDFAGHGHSSHRSGPYHFVDYVGDLLQLCRQQQWQGLTLVGHSMGAMVACAFAAAFPELVHRLVLIDAMGLMTAEAQDVAAQLRQGLLSRLQSPQKQMPVYADLAHAALARHKQSDFDLDSALLLAERGTKPVAGGVSWRSDVRLREVSAIRYTPDQVHLLLAQIQCPVLAVLATDGLSLTQQAVQRYANDFQKLTLVSLSGGHHLHLTNTAAVADVIQRFFSEN